MYRLGMGDIWVRIGHLQSEEVKGHGLASAAFGLSVCMYICTCFAPMLGSSATFLFINLAPGNAPGGMRDLFSLSTFTATSGRSRVEVGCRGWDV